MQLDERFVSIANLVKLGHDPGDPILCSHCPFCGSGQITGRSDGGIDCAFCGQSFIVRVQPAFPGMPQAPGMGAPTDAGPDMGAMPPPGMGEGGMPPGAGGPPGAEGEEGPPFGEEGAEGEEGGPPGEAAEEEGDQEDEEKGAPPFPPKKKAARAAAPAARAAYRTLAGDLLDEDRYVRHLAILHSGFSPAVIRLVRQGYLTTGDTPHHRAKYDEGYSASENAYEHEIAGRSPLEEADLRGEPDSWYQGYMDHATDRPYGHAIECPAHDHDVPGCTLVDYPEKFDPAYTRQHDTAWLGEHRIKGSRNGSLNH